MPRSVRAAAGAGSDDFLQFDDSMFANFDAVMAAATQAGNDVLITLNGANSIRLSNVALGSLHANDFLFTWSVDPRSSSKVTQPTVRRIVG